MRYTVYTSNVSYKPEHQSKTKWSLGADVPVYVRHVNAASRLEALEKCLTDIKAELPKIKGKFLSVFVGAKSNPSEAASRLHPFQVDVQTGAVRSHR